MVSSHVSSVRKRIRVDPNMLRLVILTEGLFAGCTSSLTVVYLLHHLLSAVGQQPGESMGCCHLQPRRDTHFSIRDQPPGRLSFDSGNTVSEGEIAKEGCYGVGPAERALHTASGPVAPTWGQFHPAVAIKLIYPYFDHQLTPRISTIDRYLALNFEVDAAKAVQESLGRATNTTKRGLQQTKVISAALCSPSGQRIVWHLRSAG